MPLDYKIHSTTPDLVLFVKGHGVLTVDDINKFDVFFKQFLTGETPFKVLFDLRSLTSTSIDVIKVLVVNIGSFEALAPKKVIASSVLVGPTIETWVNLLFNLKQPSTPTKVTSSLTEACDFLNEFESNV